MAARVRSVVRVDMTREMTRENGSRNDWVDKRACLSQKSEVMSGEEQEENEEETCRLLTKELEVEQP